ncbi:translocation protein SEC62-like isoform X1 [Mytilus galloprovincialis]|uniref:translocation protein SEC62-like isoform X1 n=1 Tax=Mytilus galloprovincialis TaxID=29158 RepID=UPI003F7C4571
MTKGQQGIPLRSNVVIKPQFIITDFSSDEDVDSDENVDENSDTDNEKGNDNYDGNFFKKQSFDHEGIVPMEVLQENKPNSLIENMTENDAEEEDEKPIEETEDEKNRRNFLDWKQKLENGEEKCTKEEYAVAKHLRFNIPIKEAKFVAMGEEVKCFIAKDAVDALMDSKWAKKSDGEIQISDRKSCVNLMNTFLQKGLFHRAIKVERKKDKSDKAKKKKKDDDAIEEDKKSKKEKKKAITDGQDSESKTEDKKKDKKDEDKKEEKKEEKKKKERRLKLNMHDDQIFLDGDNIYVWIYDPIPAKTFLIGLLMVVGAVGFCLFPLWPDEIRIGVYYLSLVGASFVGFVLFLVVLKQILFCLLWLLTFGKIHFWLFPNLTEDVGVLESFKPFYEVKRPGETKKAKDVKKEMRKRREKALENEETESETQEMDAEKTEEQGFEMVSHEDITENGDKVQDENEEEDKDHEGDDEDVGEEEDVKDNETGDNSDNGEDKKNK